MSSDLFTKNLNGPDFNKHTKVYCGDDEYFKVDDSQGESVEGWNQVENQELEQE